jgi:hypothetical protein
VSALDWNPTSSDDQNEIFSATKSGVDTEEKYVTESMSTLSGDISDMEYDPTEQSSQSWIRDCDPTADEENEALRSARELFEVEEELRDEHFACLQVCCRFVGIDTAYSTDRCDLHSSLTNCRDSTRTWHRCFKKNS